MKYINFAGTILAIRNIEDCIRASHRYTEGVVTMRAHHPNVPIQGGEFPNKRFCKHYEVYPEMEVGWEMPVDNAVNLLWGDTPCVDVTFTYDYRVNLASMMVHGDIAMMKALVRRITGLIDLLNPSMTTNGYRELVGVALKETREDIKADKAAEEAATLPQKPKTLKERLAAWLPVDRRA